MQEDSGIQAAVTQVPPPPPRSLEDVGDPASTETRGPRPPVADRSVYEKMLLDHLEFIERTVAVVARRHAVAWNDAEDLGAQVKLRLMVDDYAVLRKFEGRSRLTTYLTTVIHNIFRDFRIQRWGKWRPSAAARRMGDLGVQLEALLYRDWFGEHEAFAILRDRFEVEATDRELESMAARLRPRTSRRIETDAALTRLEAKERGDEAVREGERAESRLRVARALCKALESLEPEDRLILRMRFADGLTIRAIAEALDLEQRRMYTRVQRLLLDVRRRVEDQGVGCDEVLDVLDEPGADLEASLREASDKA